MNGVCRVCGCTDDDCSQCIEATGHFCYWIEEDLCSRCDQELRNPGLIKAEELEKIGDLVDES